MHGTGSHGVPRHTTDAEAADRLGTTRIEKRTESVLDTRHGEALALSPCPSNCERVVHIWHDRQRSAEVREL
jgi:hypothetical protein